MNFDDFGPQQGWSTFWKTQRDRESFKHCEKSTESMKLNNKSTKPCEKIYGIDEIESTNLLNPVKNLRN